MKHQAASGGVLSETEGVRLHSFEIVALITSWRHAWLSALRNVQEKFKSR